MKTTFNYKAHFVILQGDHICDHRSMFTVFSLSIYSYITAHVPYVSVDYSLIVLKV